ncbi:MAG: arginine deiminase-related protein [Polyangiales bacterium]
MIAFTRPIPSSFAQATTAIAPDPPIDVARAGAQHAAYVRALAGLGVQVIQLEADDRFPDGCFVEDCAVIGGGVGLITRPGAATRRGEVDSVAEALAAHGKLTALHRMEAPATLDGGDCLRVGRTLYVGLSQRTNAAGVARAIEVFAPHGIRVAPVPLAQLGVLHLKCVCSALGDDRVLLAEGTIPRETFAGLDVVMIPNDEAYAANCLAHGGSALVSSGFAATHETLDRAGVRVVPLETSEIRKADGALTCLSILV